VLDRRYISHKEFDEIYDKLVTLSRKIGSLMSYLHNSDLKGSKFK
jgi:hypothetical protein